MHVHLFKRFSALSLRMMKNTKRLHAFEVGDTIHLVLVPDSLMVTFCMSVLLLMKAVTMLTDYRTIYLILKANMKSYYLLS